MKKQLLQEGKSHMWHPFDLDYVKNGKDLLSVFENQVIDYLNQFNSSIKIDGSKTIAGVASTLAHSESLTAHARSAEYRRDA